MTGTMHSEQLDIDYVDVADEPDHVEQVSTPAVRLYLATIRPGAATLYHRHDRDTFYVILAGGRFRSDEPGRQRAGSKVGRSVSVITQLIWLIRRRLFGGWLSMPTGTLLVQPHTEHPLIHRVIADAQNAMDIRMLGVEPRSDHPAAVLSEDENLTCEYRNRHLNAYRLRLAPGQRRRLSGLSAGVVIAVIEGAADVDGHHLSAGEARLVEDARSMRIDAGDRGVSALVLAL